MTNRKTNRKYGNKRYTKTKRIYKGGVDGDICVICHEALEVGDEIYTHTDCKSKFHMSCIKKWCAGKLNCPCPVCRGTVIPLNENELIENYKILLQENADLKNGNIELSEALEASHKSYTNLTGDYNKLIEEIEEIEEKYNALLVENTQIKE